MTFSRRLLFILLILAVIVAVAIAAFLPLSRNANAPSAQPAVAAQAAPVIVAAIRAARDDVVVDAVGSALASHAVIVYPAVAGEIERVTFSAGQRVKEGELLVQLVDRAERIAADQAEARVAAAARLLKRYEETRGSGAISDSVLDEARLALRSAELELAQAREALRDRTVRAPFSGVVGIVRVDPGNRVTTTTALTTLDRRDPLSVAFQVPEPFLGRLQHGQEVALETVAFPGRSFTGTLTRIDSRVDPVTRTLTVRADVPNPDDLLRPGMSFSVRLALPGEPVLRVPELAVQWGREGSHVWVVRDGLGHKVPVRVVRRLDAVVLVDGELRAGEPVVLEGFHRLRPQRPVQIVQERTIEADDMPQPALEQG